jgi:hypothetical protein
VRRLVAAFIFNHCSKPYCLRYIWAY